jgi:hypothetical protein
VALALAATCACALSVKTPAKLPVRGVRAGHKPVALAAKHGNPESRKPLRVKSLAPAAEERPLAPIVVNHDRKRHYSADPAPGDGSFKPVLYDRRGHLIVPAALKGSHEILLRQNEIADS